jgi:hypothetical protein
LKEHREIDLNHLANSLYYMASGSGLTKSKKDDLAFQWTTKPPSGWELSASENSGKHAIVLPWSE